jgi:hypothetical protein
MAKEIKLLGFNFTKIQAEKSKSPEGKVEVNANVDINSIEKQKLELIKEEALTVNFSFNISYKELGKVEFGGVIILAVDPKTLKETLSQWKDKSVSPEFKTMIFNIVLQRCTAKALQIEEEIDLPFHIQMPQVQHVPESSKK